MQCPKDGYQMIKVPYCYEIWEGSRTAPWANSDGRNIKSVVRGRIGMCRRQTEGSGMTPTSSERQGQQSHMVLLPHGKNFCSPHDHWGRLKPLQYQGPLSLAIPKPT